MAVNDVSPMFTLIWMVVVVVVDSTLYGCSMESIRKDSHGTRYMGVDIKFPDSLGPFSMYNMLRTEGLIPFCFAIILM